MISPIFGRFPITTRSPRRRIRPVTEADHLRPPGDAMLPYLDRGYYDGICRSAICAPNRCGSR
jgi:hypothetical protein